jgi:hypothetical protein
MTVNAGGMYSGYAAGVSKQKDYVLGAALGRGGQARDEQE